MLNSTWRPSRGINLLFGSQFEYRLAASTSETDPGYGQAPFAFGVGAAIKNTNLLPITFGLGFLLEAASAESADTEPDAIDGKTGLGIDLSIADPSSTFGLDIGSVLAFSAPAVDVSTLDLFDVSGWVKTGATTFRIGFHVTPENGGNLDPAYKGPAFNAVQNAKGVTALYLRADLSF